MKTSKQKLKRRMEKKILFGYKKLKVTVANQKI